MIVLRHSSAVAIQLACVRNRDDGNRSSIGMHIALLFRILPTRSSAEQGGYRQVASIWRQRESVRVPRRRNESFDLAGGQAHNSYGVDATTRNIQAGSVGRPREGCRCHPTNRLLERLKKDCLAHPVLYGIDDRNRILVAIGDIEAAS